MIEIASLTVFAGFIALALIGHVSLLSAVLFSKTQD
jgi:Flp pilus assembly pilin Flp